MDNILKNQIVTLGNGNKYFVLEEIDVDNNTYDFLLNIDEENNIEVSKKDIVDSKIILREIKDEDERKKIIEKFKEII